MPTADESNEQRAAIKSVLTSPEWSKKVNLMPADQVAVVYLSLKKQNKI